MQCAAHVFKNGAEVWRELLCDHVSSTWTRMQKCESTAWQLASILPDAEDMCDRSLTTIAFRSVRPTGVEAITVSMVARSCVTLS